MGRLINFYPQHIEKEDERFFPDTEHHFSKEEQEKMIEDFYTFDRKMIHRKYNSVVASQIARKE